MQEQPVEIANIAEVYNFCDKEFTVMLGDTAPAISEALRALEIHPEYDVALDLPDRLSTPADDPNLNGKAPD